MTTIRDMAVNSYRQRNGDTRDMRDHGDISALMDEMHVAWADFVDRQPEPEHVWRAVGFTRQGVILSGDILLYYHPPVIDNDHCWHIDPEFRWIVTDMQSLGRAILEYGNEQRRRHSYSRPDNNLNIGHEEKLIRVLERIAQALEWHAPF